jgi:hypothetical protein
MRSPSRSADGLDRALVGHFQEPHARGLLEHFAGDQDVALPEADGQLSGALLRSLHDIVHGLVGALAVDDHHPRGADDKSDRDEIIELIVLDVLHEVGIDRKRGTGREQERVAIRRHPRRSRRSDRPIGARPIVDDERLAEFLANVVLQYPGDRVGPAACPIWNNERDGLGGVSLGVRRGGQGDERKDSGDQRSGVADQRHLTIPCGHLPTAITQRKPQHPAPR